MHEYYFTPALTQTYLKYDDGHELGLSGDQILDGFLFANGAMVDCVWVGGAKQVEAGRHKARERVAARFVGVMRELMSGF